MQTDKYEKYLYFMKIALSVLVLTSFVLGLKAQEGILTFQQDPRIELLIQLYTEINTEIELHQIQVGFGSYQKAQSLKAQVDVDFPGWESSIVFESPTYRVRLGRFKTKLEAERKYLEVRKKYPDAILLQPERHFR